MTEQESRYDRVAEGYATWWSPIHRPATLRLLDEVAGDVAGGAAGDLAGTSGRLLDVGCGTGALAVAAAERWRHLGVDAVDASEGMLAIARRELATRPASVRERVRFMHGYADRLPLDDGAVDVAVSAFVLQLVPSRSRALREVRRVLRPGGRLAYVSWLRGGASFAADGAYDDALAAAGLDAREPGDGDDAASPEAAIGQLRRAGFRDATARADRVEHRFTPEGYLGFVTRFDDEDLFATMDPAARAALEADLLGRLRALPPDGLRLVLPIVYASGRRT